MPCRSTVRRNHIYTPDGVKVALNLDDPGLKRTVEESLIAPYRDMIEKNWLDSGKRSSVVSMEERVKRYLERLATLLLHDPGEHVILTDSMQRRIARREMELAEYLEATPAARSKRVYQKKETGIHRSVRLQTLHTKYPGAVLQWIPVDTDGVFCLNGDKYLVFHPAYAPVQLAGDVYYPMDSIGVLLFDGALHYFTQALDEIEEAQMTRLAIPDCGINLTQTEE